ncbi:MAG: stage II sporulation protein M [Pseudomonadales bacterium]
MSDQPSHDKATAAWFKARQGVWQQLAERLPELEDRKAVSRETALAAMRLYPEIARDLAIARRVAPSGRLTRYLQQVYARVHRLLFREPWSFKQEVWRLFAHDAPDVAARLWRHIAGVTLGFILSGFAGWWLVATYPELAGLFASEEMIKTVQGGELWTDGLLNVMPSSLLSVGIFTNNIVVTLTAVSLGVLYGLGTIYIIGLNGLMLGGVFAFTAQYGLAGRLFEFVAAHGFVELSIICIAGAIGFYVGEAIARPGHLSRIESFRRAMTSGSKLLAVCAVFLVGAGLIEGYISPDERFSLTMRLVIGLGYWVVFILTLVGPLGKHRQHRPIRSAGAPSTSGSVPTPASRDLGAGR